MDVLRPDPGLGFAPSKSKQKPVPNTINIQPETDPEHHLNPIRNRSRTPPKSNQKLLPNTI